MFLPGFVARINFKSLLPEETFKLSVDRLLTDLKRDTLRRIREKIRKESAFSPRAKARLSRGLEIELGPSSITLIAKDPAFLPLIKGQKKGQMKWLRGARAPIPIVLDSGELIFRTASEKSFQRGAWKHPGRPDTHIIDIARKEARAAMKKRLKKLLQDKIRSMRTR